ncbi:AAA family ATPase [Enterobacter kobei]|uniref:AAA family ATPase n=1 Tax=Enterobacter kobei TaxID=208224 RepID=UPI001BCC2622|nr:AAA family ATPase [Enterobacter kobei]MCE1978771.1 AAA family ATPase [Enterobacter kobei]MDY3577726.1 AAA family ATPase [Enterobacter kobei]DAT38792.1 MAG TPA: STRUCTURAL MAINTENANCE OF CHROMOSOMES PROTEIN [Caudoviricetes sp.]
MTPIESIAEWAQRKPVWWRHALRLSLTHGSLDQECLSIILKIAKTEHGLLEGDEVYERAVETLDFTGFTSEQNEVSLKTLCNVKGVGLLAENQTINFPEQGLFIVYGDNGAGKSSYSSILKNTCLTRGDCPQILGDVFSKEQIPPQAEISVTVNGLDEVFLWDNNTSSIEALKSIRVFDSSSANHYINKEDALGFKPVGLNLLAELVRAVNSVRAHIEEDTMGNNGFIKLDGLKSSSAAAMFFSNLSADTLEDEINEHCITLEELEKIEPLKKEVYHFKSQTPQTLRKNLQQRKATLDPLVIFCDKLVKLLDDKAIESLEKLKAGKEKTATVCEELRKTTLQNLPFDNIAGVSWQKIWLATQHFIQHDEKKHFPMVAGEFCPVCFQEINNESESKMEGLYKYLNDQSEQEAILAKGEYDDALNKILALSFDLTPYSAAISLLNNEFQELGDEVISMTLKLEGRRDILVGKSVLPHLPLMITSITKIKNIIEDINAKLLVIESDEELNNFIQTKELELVSLEDRKYILDCREIIVANLRRHKEVEKLNSILSQCNTATISTLSSSIYRSGVVEPLVSAFNDELKSFGFDRFRVKVESRNRSGVQQFKLSLADRNNNVIGALSVASEGEQRCIAIASFLAEMKADSRKSAIIFDDPVNSLSHEWSSRVAKRLVLESQRRQVVILTHNIVFYKLLLEVAEGTETEHSTIALERSRKFAGIVKNSAPWEAMTTRARYGFLKVKLQDIKRLEKKDETTTTELRDACCQFYSYLREAWERLVEEKLLNKVVTRFERGVSTQRLARLIDICQSDIDRVDFAMSKCSTYFRGHDSAAAIGDPYPSVEEVEADLSSFFEFLNELEEKPRKRN